jgi:hypothetical protein
LDFPTTIFAIESNFPLNGILSHLEQTSSYLDGTT